jgi:CheY-like chemotaxis protein
MGPEELMMSQRTARIAIVNDDTAFLDLMQELLEQEEGYEVHICKEADRAYEFVKALHPDLVLLDIRVNAEENGWTILNLLTLDPATRPIPVIVCSAAIQSLKVHEALLQQYDCEVLTKPFDLDALLTMVQAALRKYRRGRA